jgi:hypothetical protein
VPAREAEGTQEDVDLYLRLLAHLGGGDGGDDGGIASLGGAAERDDVDGDVQPAPDARHLVPLLGIAHPAVRDHDHGRRRIAAETAGQLPEGGGELGIGIVGARQLSACQELVHVHRNEPLAEAVDANVGVPLLAFEGGAEQGGAFLPARLGAAQVHALRGVEQDVDLGPLDGAGRDIDAHGIQADDHKGGQHATPEEPQGHIPGASQRRRAPPPRPPECHKGRREPRQHRPIGAEIEGHDTNLEHQ